MRGRIKEDDSSVPYFFNGYWYITRFEKNKDYPIYIRKKGDLKTKEEILFDCNIMAKGHEYFDLVSFSVSPDNTKVSFGVDTLSRRQYTIQVKDLITKKILKTKIKNTTGESVWANDNKSLFYNIKNPITLRSEAVLKHDISFPNRKDKVVYAEKNKAFSVNINKSKSQEYLLISSSSTLMPRNLTSRCDKTPTTAAEKPHCGNTGVPFMNSTTDSLAISLSIRVFKASSNMIWLLTFGGLHDYN